jgi:hypothetical protein
LPDLAGRNSEKADVLKIYKSRLRKGRVCFMTLPFYLNEDRGVLLSELKFNRSGSKVFVST